MISDRIDDALEPPGPARLDAHLRNCARCVEHERRLAQATDSLVAAFAERHGAPAVEEDGAEPAGPTLEVVERPAGPRAVPWRPVAPRPRSAPASAEAEAPSAVKAEPAPAVEPEPARVTPPEPARVEEPAAAREAPSPAAAEPRRRASAPLASLAWGALFALAVLLAVATVALAVIGALGGSL
jgi:hypothetical protein